MFTDIEERHKTKMKMMATSRSQRVQSRSKDDVIDRFFSWSEQYMCPTAVQESIPAKEDELDYVFDHVESFVCRGDDVTQGRNDTPSGQPRSLTRDNSIIDNNSILEAACQSVSSKYKKKTQRARSVKPMGEKGDILDLCFDQVESYACGEATGELDNLPSRNQGTRSSIVSSLPENEPEDEIQLYFTPNHRGR